MIRAFTSIGKTLKALRGDRSGLALIEFAYSLPLLTTMIMAGGELTNFTTVRMRISQISIHVADNAARMGSGTLLSVKTISETQINDLFKGADLQGGKLNILANGRVILSDLEVDPVNSGKYKIAWARCKGVKNSTSTYGVPVTSNLVGMGPAGAQVTAPSGGATMFVEIFYTYQPVVSSKFTPKSVISEIAAMTVRDNRDLTQIYNSEGVSTAGKALCSAFTSTFVP